MYGARTRPLNIGIDLDDTITADQALFKDLIEVLKKHGHKVYIVTARGIDQYCEVLREFEPLVDKVIFTGAKAKMECALIDIWIDDWPIAITHDFKKTHFVACNELVRGGWVK